MFERIYQVRVIRKISSETLSINSSEVVVGDVILIEKGMKVPADCLLLEGEEVVCLEKWEVV